MSTARDRKGAMISDVNTDEELPPTMGTSLLRANPSPLLVLSNLWPQFTSCLGVQVKWRWGVSVEPSGALAEPLKALPIHPVTSL